MRANDVLLPIYDLYISAAYDGISYPDKVVIQALITTEIVTLVNCIKKLYISY